MQPEIGNEEIIVNITQYGVEQHPELKYLT